MSLHVSNDRNHRRTALVFAALFIAGLCAACGGSKTLDPGPTVHVPLDAPAPWTDAFLTKATIIADVIEIEGPAGVRNHCAGRQDQENVDYELVATDRGLQQTYAVKPGVSGTALGVWLDNWELYAFERIVVLERPTRGGLVTVRARGQVVASLPEGETRSARFERNFEVGP